MPECSHSITAFGLCVACGSQVHTDEHQQKRLHLVHNAPEISVEQSLAEAIGHTEEQHLRDSKKLILVLDLDQTLLHTTVKSLFPNIDAVLEESNTQGVFKYSLDHSPDCYYTKFRPFLNEFLQELSPLYELHVFTMGSRDYAEKLLEFIPESSAYFQSRVLCRADFIDSNAKDPQLRHVFPSGDDLVAIVDDRADVWVGCDNLINIRPYVFFTGTADINALPKDEHDTAVDTSKGCLSASAQRDTSLLHLEGFLKRVHCTFFKSCPHTDSTPSSPLGTASLDSFLDHMIDEAIDSASSPVAQPSVKSIIVQLFSEILKDCIVTFSAVIPLDYAEPQTHKYWLLAEKLGAECFVNLQQDRRTATHLVTNNTSSQKSIKARSLAGTKIVPLKWLLDCADQFTRVDESDYADSKNEAMQV